VREREERLLDATGPTIITQSKTANRQLSLSKTGTSLLLPDLGHGSGRALPSPHPPPRGEGEGNKLTRLAPSIGPAGKNQCSRIKNIKDGSSVSFLIQNFTLFKSLREEGIVPSSEGNNL